MAISLRVTNGNIHNLRIQSNALPGWGGKHAHGIDLSLVVAVWVLHFNLDFLSFFLFLTIMAG